MSEQKVQESKPVAPAQAPTTAPTVTPNSISPEDQWLTEGEKSKLASVKAFRDKIYAMSRMSEYENFGKSTTEKQMFWEEFVKLSGKEGRAVMAGEKVPNVQLEGVDLEKMSDEELRSAIFKLWVERKRKGEI